MLGPQHAVMRGWRIRGRVVLALVASLAAIGWLVTPGFAGAGGNGSSNTNRQVSSSLGE